jgi:hypothetical protein
MKKILLALLIACSMHQIMAIQVKVKITNTSKSSIHVPLALSLDGSTKSQTIHLAPSQTTFVSLNVPGEAAADLKIAATGPLSSDLMPNATEQQATFD